MAAKSGIDILTFRPRSTELYQMGALKLMDTQDGFDGGKEGVYRARATVEWEAWLAEQREGLTSRQMQML